MSEQVALSVEHDVENLVRAVRSGDLHAFGEFCERFSSSFRRFLHCPQLPPDEADDLAQEVLLGIFKSAPPAPNAVATPVTFRIWLYSVAENAAHDWLRSSRSFFAPEVARSLRAFTRSVLQFMESLLAGRLSIRIHHANTSPPSKDCRSTFKSWFFLHGAHPPRALALAAVRFGQGFGKVCYGPAVD